MLKLLNSWRESSAVPPGWAPCDPPGAVTKRPVKNSKVLALLQSLLPGRWRKVYHRGRDGTEMHYFQHASGKVAFAKHKLR
jgi:hypothetical protein